MIVRTTAKVRSIRNITDDVFNIVLKPEKEIKFKAGQFIIVQVIINNQPVRRSYSISSKESDENIMLTIKKVNNGTVSSFLHDMKTGDEVVLLGPAGHFTLRSTDNTELFIGAGTGIAPLRSMIYASKAKNKILLSGHRKNDDVVFREEFEELAKKDKGFKYYYCTSREDSEGLKGHVQDNLHKIISGTDYECYVCGLKEMVLETVAKLEELGIPRKQIHFERYN